MAKGDKQDVAKAKAAVSKKKVRGGVSQAKAFKTMASAKAQAGRSELTGRSSYVKANTSIWTADKDRSVNERKKRNKESVKSTPKQLKDVRNSKFVPKADGRFYTKVSKNGTKIKKSHVFETTFKQKSGRLTPTKVRETSTSNTSGSTKSTAAKVSSDKKNAAKNKMKANPKIGLSPTSSALERARAKRGNK